MDTTATLENPSAHFTYAGFWSRFGALLLDVCIILPVTLPITYFNVADWKSTTVMTVLSFLTLCYKPFFEFKYGATPGKMALNLRVVNLNHQRPNLEEVLLRNIFQIAANILAFLASWVTFRSPEFGDVTGFMEFSQLARNSIWSTSQTLLSVITALVDFGFLVSDDKCRTLHDRIGKTYVLRTS